MGIKHRKRTGIPAGDPTGLVGGTNWLDDHDHVPFEVAMFLAAGNAGVAAVAVNAGWEVCSTGGINETFSLSSYTLTGSSL